MINIFQFIDVVNTIQQLWLHFLFIYCMYCTVAVCYLYLVNEYICTYVNVLQNFTAKYSNEEILKIGH